VPHDVRDQVVDFVRRWSEKTEIGVGRFIHWLGVTASKFYDWQQRYGCVNEHNGWVPRDFWLELWEKEAIIDFHMKNPLEGYRRLTFMMLDADVVAVSPASVWRVLKQAGLLSRWKTKRSRKGTGFEQPLQPHQHWHIDVSYINVCGNFLLLVQRSGWLQSIHRALGPARVDEGDRNRGHSRTSQGNVPRGKAADHLRQRAAVHRTRLQGVHSNLRHDACPNFTLLSPIERWHESLKSECIRPGTPLSLDDARRLVQGYVEHYNNIRWNSAIGYITPKDMLAGRQQEIHADRDRKLVTARQQRQLRRKRHRQKLNCAHKR
jgi:putative transposase